MNIVCEKTLLSNAIDGVSRAVTLRSSISALEGIHMVADGFSLTGVRQQRAAGWRRGIKRADSIL